MIFLNRIELNIGEMATKKLLLVAAAALALAGFANGTAIVGNPVVIYATQPGHTASDGIGKNSPFTEALLKHMGTPGDTLREMFFRVKMDVVTATEGRQRPWAPGWPLSPFYFAPAEPASAPTEAKRVALVIGNGAYDGDFFLPLRNPGNDARAVAAKLRGLGFDVVQGIDLDRSGFLSKMKEFAKRAEDAEAAMPEAMLLFYAGHGVRVDGENYLIPVDAGSLESKADLRRAMLKLDDMPRTMTSGPILHLHRFLVFLDMNLLDMNLDDPIPSTNKQPR